MPNDPPEPVLQPPTPQPETAMKPTANDAKQTFTFNNRQLPATVFKDSTNSFSGFKWQN